MFAPEMRHKKLKDKLRPHEHGYTMRPIPADMPSAHQYVAEFLDLAAVQSIVDHLFGRPVARPQMISREDRRASRSLWANFVLYWKKEAERLSIPLDAFCVDCGSMCRAACPRIDGATKDTEVQVRVTLPFNQIERKKHEIIWACGQPLCPNCQRDMFHACRTCRAFTVIDLPPTER